MYDDFNFSRFQSVIRSLASLRHVVTYPTNKKLVGAHGCFDKKRCETK